MSDAFDASTPLSKRARSGSKILVMRGFVFYSFDMASNEWMRLPDMRRDRGYFQAVVFNNEIFAIGTYSLVAAGTMEKFSFVTNSWENLQSMPHKMKSVSATVFKGSLFIIGGIDIETEAAFDGFYRYLPATESTPSSWEIMSAPLLNLRYGHASVAFRGELWIAGGKVSRKSGVHITSSVEIYSEEDAAWREGPSLTRKRDFFHLLVVLGDLYAVGGDVDKAERPMIRTIEKLVGAGSELHWELVTEFPDFRRGFSACAVGTKIYVLAGDSRNSDGEDDYHTLSTWDAFDVATGAWMSTSLPASERSMPLIDNWGQALEYDSVSIEESTLPARRGSYQDVVRPDPSRGFIGIVRTGSVEQADGGSFGEWVGPSAPPVLTRQTTEIMKLYVMRGFVFYSYDMAANIWTRLPDMRRDRGYFESVVLNNEIYAIGTYSLIAAGTMEKFSFVTNSWAQLQSMPHKMKSVGATVFKGSLFIIGGIDSETEVVFNGFYRYNPAAESTGSSWVLMSAPLLNFRYGHASGEFRGELWIAGGKMVDKDGSVSITNSVEIYSEEDEAWREGPSLTRKRDFFHLLVVLGDLYAVGGDVDKAERPMIRTIEKLVGTGSELHWELVTEFPDFRRGFSTCAVGTKIYVLAGDSRNSDGEDDYHTLSTWDAFDVATGAWMSVHTKRPDRTMPLIDNWGQAVAIVDSAFM